MPPSPAPCDPPESPRPWYQTTIRELLWLTTLSALTLSLLKTLGVVALIALDFSLRPCLLVLDVFFAFREQCQEHGLWSPPRVSSTQGSEVAPPTDAYRNARLKREAFLRLVPGFVGREALLVDADSTRPVQVERVVAGFGGVRARLRETRATSWTDPPKSRRFGKRWEIFQTWTDFEFSVTEWNAARGAGWRLLFSQELATGQPDREGAQENS